MLHGLQIQIRFIDVEHAFVIIGVSCYRLEIDHRLLLLLVERASLKARTISPLSALSLLQLFLSQAELIDLSVDGVPFSQERRVSLDGLVLEDACNDTV